MQNDNQITLNEPHAKPLVNANDPKPEPGSYVDQPLNPLWLILITVVAGLPASAPVAGAIAVRCGYRRLGWVCGALLTIFGIVSLALAAVWGVEWYWTTLALVAFNIVCGSGLYLLLRKPQHAFKENHPLPPGKRGGYRQIITGMVGGAMISLLLAFRGIQKQAQALTMRRHYLIIL